MMMMTTMMVMMKSSQSSDECFQETSSESVAYATIQSRDITFYQRFFALINTLCLAIIRFRIQNLFFSGAIFQSKRGHKKDYDQQN